MAQLDFYTNLPNIENGIFGISNGTLSFIPLNLANSISWATLNFLICQTSAASKTLSLSIGLYSLTGSTLSIANSISRSVTYGTSAQSIYLSMVGTSATQNITPGTWWLGLLASTAGANAFSFFGQTSVNPTNAFPGGFIGGRMTASTAALPSTYATSDLDITGNDAMNVPLIILSA